MAKKVFLVTAMFFSGTFSLLSLISCIWQTVDVFCSAGEINLNQFGWPLIQGMCVLLWADCFFKTWDDLSRLR